MKMSNTTNRTDVEQWLDAIDPATTPTKDARHLRAVGEALTALEQAEARLQRAVADARNAGDSWTAIGAVLGTSRQAAHRKYAYATSGTDDGADPHEGGAQLPAELAGPYSVPAELGNKVAAQHQSSSDGAATDSTSALVEANTGTVQASKALPFWRSVPQAPPPLARRGTTFHAWLERYFTSALLELEDLPIAQDSGVEPEPEVEDLKAKFLRSIWARKVPVEVELPFSLTIGRQPVRGRVDAVFRDEDGGCTVVDWKIGQPPGGDRRRAATVQLAVYRLALAQMFDLPLNKVRPSFVYIQAEETFAPRYLLDADALASMAETTIIQDWAFDLAS